MVRRRKGKGVRRVWVGGGKEGGGVLSYTPQLTVTAALAYPAVHIYEAWRVDYEGKSVPLAPDTEH